MSERRKALFKKNKEKHAFLCCAAAFAVSLEIESAAERAASPRRKPAKAPVASADGKVLTDQERRLAVQRQPCHRPAPAGAVGLQARHLPDHSAQYPW